jgi:tetratricopeptide (TPR) repeat protein
LERACRHQQVAVTANPRDPAARKALASHWYDLGIVLTSLRKPGEAVEAYRQVIPLAEQRVRESPAAAEGQDFLARSLHNQALLLRNQGSLTEAYGHEQRAMEHHQAALGRDPTNATYRRSLLNCYVAFAILCKKLGKADDAERAYGEEVSRVRQLVKDRPDVPLYPSELGAYLNNLAVCVSDRDEWAQACALLQEAVEQQRSALKVAPGDKTCRERLRTHYQAWASVLLRQGEHAAAARIATGTLDLLPDDWQRYHDAARILSTCVARVAKDASLSQGRRAALAQSYGGQAVALLRQAVAKGDRRADELHKLDWSAPLRSRDDFKQLVAEIQVNNRKKERKQ